MVKTKTLKTPNVVTITAPWQLTFLAAMVLGQLSWVVLLLWTYVLHHGYMGVGTWTWQISYWVYPLFYVAASYAFICSRVRGALPRLFWAVFLATIGEAVYTFTSSIFNWLRFDVIRAAAPTGNGLWAAFGWDWVHMGVVFGLFCLTLYIVARRKRA